jgi:hypothetical protein
MWKHHDIWQGRSSKAAGVLHTVLTVSSLPWVLPPSCHGFFCVACSYPYERDLLRYLEQLIRDMDTKIRKNKERADAESRPKVLKLDDQRRLDEMKQRQAGGLEQLCRLMHGPLECLTAQPLFLH